MLRLWIISLILVFAAGFWFGKRFENRVIYEDEKYKRFESIPLESGDSAGLKLLYIKDNSNMTYQILIKFSEIGCGKEAYEKMDFKPRLQLMDSLGFILKEINLTKPKHLWDDSIGLCGIRYENRITMQFNTFQRINHFNIPITSSTIRKFTNKTKNTH